MKEPTRILHLGPLPPEAGGKEAGGIATHAWELAACAARNGFEVFYYAEGAGRGERDSVRLAGPPPRPRASRAARTLALALAPARAGRPPLPALSWRERGSLRRRAGEIRGALAGTRPRLLHLHSLLNPLGLAAAEAGPSLPLVATNYELWFEKGGEREIEAAARLLGRVSSLIHISRYTAERFRRLGLADPARSRVIHPPVDGGRVDLRDRAEAKRALGRGEEPLIFFYGTFDAFRKKGLDLLLRAVAGETDLRRNCRLALRTGGEAARRAREIMDREGIAGEVLPPISREKLSLLYNAADLFAMPSRSEGFGIAYLEALLAGTPVLGFAPTLREIEEKLRTSPGEGFDAGSGGPDGLAAAIRRLLSARFDRALLRRRTIEAFGWDRAFGRFAEVYAEALAEPGGAGA